MLALTLALYEYTLATRSTTQHGNTDAISRLPLKVKAQDTPQPPEFILTLDTMSEGPIVCSEIRTWIRQDSWLSTVLRHTEMSWPLQFPEEELKPYWSRRNELALLDSCICGALV